MLGLFAVLTLLLEKLPFLPPFLLFSMLGCVPLLLSSKPRASDLLVFIALALAYFMESRTFGRSIDISLGLSFGFASIQTLFFDRHRSDARVVLPIALFFVCLVYMMLPVFQLVTYFTPNTIDTTLRSVDFGIGDSFYRFARAHTAVSLFFDAVYQLLPMAMAVVVSFDAVGRRRRTAALLLGASLVAVPFYIAFPAVGPVHVHDLHAPRNCVPSMHFSWAILLCAYSRQRWLRNTLIVYAVLTAIAALTTGEHYVIDLIAAAIFTGLFLGLSDRWMDRPHSSVRPAHERNPPSIAN
jgi:hypothetical protein